SALVRPPRSASATLFPYTTLFRSDGSRRCSDVCTDFLMPAAQEGEDKCAKIGVSRAGYIRISDGRGSDDLHCFSILDDDGTGAIKRYCNQWCIEFLVEVIGVDHYLTDAVFALALKPE